jgi:NitT/TauT family transport system permease protein
MNTAALVRIAIILGLVLALELVCRMGWVRPGLIVAPSVMAQELWALMQTPKFWGDVGTSTRSIVVAFVLSMVVGCTVAIVLNHLPRLRESLEPLIASYYALPFFVLYPLLVVLMGMNQAPIIAIGFLYAVMAVIIGTLSGLDRIPVVLRQTAKVHRLSSARQAFFISLPAAAPYVFTGAKLAFGYSITGVLGSEFILADSGFGYEVSFAYNNFSDRKMYALLLFLLVVVSLVTILIHRAERSVQHRSGPAKAAIERKPVSSASKILAALAVTLTLLAVWQLVHLRVGDEALASPLATGERLASLLVTARFWGHIEETLLALGLAILISCIAGTLIGVLLGLSRIASEATSPMLVTLYSLPKVALYPIVLLLVGIGLASKVTFGAMYGAIPMILIGMNAIRSMNPTYRLTARVMRLTHEQTLRTIVIPAVVPEIVTGIRVSFSLTLLGVMIGEMFASNRGLGFLIMNGINVNDTATMMAVTVLVALVAVAINAGLLEFERRISRA